MLKNLLQRFVRATAPRNPTELQVTALTSFALYQQWQAQEAAVEQERRAVERRLASEPGDFTVRGRCFCCQADVDFAVSWAYAYPIEGELLPNWREHLVCPHCRLNNRMRAAIHLFQVLQAPEPSANLYLTEQASALFAWMATRYPTAQGSEFLGATLPFGEADTRGIRNETLTGLSFESASFDHVLSFDVLEHIPDFLAGFAECLRVLRPGGALLFTVPFNPAQEKNLVRAVVDASGEITYLQPPEYHWDPVVAGGCLAFYHFGWELLEQLRELGFADPTAHFYWSRSWGYLGRSLAILTARKPDQVSADASAG